MGRDLAYLGIGLHEEALGHYDAALSHYQRAAAGYHETGNIRGWGAATTRIGAIFHHRGDFTTALPYTEEVVRCGLEAADRQVSAWGLLWRATVKWRIGPVGEAIGDLEKAIDLFNGIPDHVGSAWANSILGGCYLRQGDFTRALPILEDAIRSITEKRLKGLLITSVPLILAETYVLIAEKAVGPRRTHMIRTATRACRAAMKQSKAHRYWLPMAFRLRGTMEWLSGKRGAAQRSWRASTVAAEEMGELYEVGLTLLESGHRTQKRADLERAEAIFIEVGTTLDALEARRILSTHPA